MTLGQIIDERNATHATHLEIVSTGGPDHVGERFPVVPKSMRYKGQM
jgi:hypothetical protein